MGITIDRDYGTQVEVVSGLTTQDAVIENPSDSLTSGIEVRVSGISTTETGDDVPNASNGR